MSFLTDASLVFIPSGYKEDKAYSVKPTDGSGDLTFTRASDGTRVNSQGLVERVPWNLATYSEQFDNAAWTKASATITANATTAPNGTTTADKLIANNGYDPSSATGNLTQTNTVPLGTYVVSLYAKAAEFTSIRFRENYAVGSFLTIDLTNGSITGGGSQYINPETVSVGNGWYRIAFTTPATANLAKYSIRVANTGDGVSGVYVWGFQLNEGSTAKPYFPTTDRLNVPRLDYSGGCPSLLLEPQRTNIVTYSEQFDDSAWLKSNCAATANQTTSPDGTINADLITTTSTSHALFQGVTVTASTAYTFSFYVKRGTMSNLSYRVYDLTNLSDIIAPTSYYSQTTESGWARVTVSFTTPAGCTSARVYPVSNSGVTGTVYLWGAQLEAGSYPTSYIPTTSASVTRVADAASKTGISSLIGQTEGVLFVDTKGTTKDVPLLIRVATSGGTYGNSIYMDIQSGGQLRATIFVGTVAQMSITTTITEDQPIRAALAYKANDCAFYLNGTQVGTDTSVTLPTSLSEVLVGSYYPASSAQQHKGINQAVLFKTRLTNEQLEYLTGTSYSTYADMASQLNYTIQ